MTQKYGFKKFLLRVFLIFLLPSLGYAESNDSADALKNAETKVQTKLEEFKKTDQYELLLEARKVASSMNPRDSSATLGKIDEGSLKLQIKVLLALNSARDSSYDPKAEKNIVYLNIMPPLTKSLQGYMAGMDPKAIKDPEERKAYEDAITENEHRNIKLKREMSLSREVDRAIIDIWHFVRGFPENSAVAKKAALDIIENSITNKTLLDRIKSDSSPGLTW